eukprot:g23281.t1
MRSIPFRSWVERRPLGNHQVEFGLSNTASVTRLKLQVTVQATPRACFELLKDASRRPEFDLGCLEVSEMESCGENADLVRMVYSSQDAKKEELLEDEEHNVFIVCSRSVRCDLRPPKEGMYRGEVLPSGYLVTAVPDTNGKCSEITFLGQFSQSLFEKIQPHVVESAATEQLEGPDVAEGGLLRQDNVRVAWPTGAPPFSRPVEMEVMGQIWCGYFQLELLQLTIAVLTQSQLPAISTRVQLTEQQTSMMVKYDQRVSEVKAKARQALGTGQEGVAIIARNGETLLEHLTVKDAGLQNQDILAAHVADDDGGLLTWGDPAGGGDSRFIQMGLEGSVVTIFSTDSAFAALKADGGVITWGNPAAGGDCSAVEAQLRDITLVLGNHEAFVALKSNGGVVAWGNPAFGGDLGAAQPLLQSGVQRLSCTGSAFAAVKSDGRCVAWGNPHAGGATRYVYDQLQRDVSYVTANEHAFVAVRKDGSVVAWGDPQRGGDLSSVLVKLKQGATGGGSTREVKAQLRSKVIALYATQKAFAALKDTGNVISWGNESDGGDVLARPEDRGEVGRIFCTQHAFAAVDRAFGRAFLWILFALSPATSRSLDAAAIELIQDYGGDCDQVFAELVGISEVCGTAYAFAALKHDGSVVTWGHPAYGGEPGNCRSSLSSQVIRLFATRHAFAAVKRRLGLDRLAKQKRLEKELAKGPVSAVALDADPLADAPKPSMEDIEKGKQRKRITAAGRSMPPVDQRGRRRRRMLLHNRSPKTSHEGHVAAAEAPRRKTTAQARLICGSSWALCPPRSEFQRVFPGSPGPSREFPEFLRPEQPLALPPTTRSPRAVAPQETAELKASGDGQMLQTPKAREDLPEPEPEGTEGDEGEGKKCLEVTLQRLPGEAWGLCWHRTSFDEERLIFAGVDPNSPASQWQQEREHQGLPLLEPGDEQLGGIGRSSEIT